MTNKLISFFKRNSKGAIIGFIIGASPAISSFVFKPATELLVRLILSPVDFVLKLISIDASLSLLVIAPFVYMVLGALIQNNGKK